MKTIFVDMDGVLCDFDKKYTELFKRTPQEVRSDRENKLYSIHWHEFVDQSAFTSLDWFEGGEKLVEYLKSLDKVQKCILSSAGGFDRHIDVQSQKLYWLHLKDIMWPAVIVPGRRFKSGFASSSAFMIDDTPDVIHSFIDKGGKGIIHTNADQTIAEIEKWL